MQKLNLEEAINTASKQLNLAQIFLSIGFRCVVASFEEIPVIGGLLTHINIIQNLNTVFPFSVTLRNSRRMRVGFSELFIYFGDPTEAFPRLFDKEVEKIREKINTKISEHYPYIINDKITINGSKTALDS